jgi:predicted esterase
MLIFHSTGDDVVPIYNAYRLQQQLAANKAANVTYDFGDYGVHGMAYARFLLNLYQQYLP